MPVRGYNNNKNNFLNGKKPSVNKEYQLDVTLPNIAMWTYKAM